MDEKIQNINLRYLNWIKHSISWDGHKVELVIDGHKKGRKKPWGARLKVRVPMTDYAFIELMKIAGEAIRTRRKRLEEFERNLRKALEG